MKNIFRLLLVAIFILTSCDSDDSEECKEIRQAFVNTIDAPTNGMVNESIPIEVKFSVINGCGQFNRFIQRSNGSMRTIEVEAKYVGCICTHNIPTRTVQYEFNPSNSGLYVLKFKSGETEFIEANIEVN